MHHAGLQVAQQHMITFRVYGDAMVAVEAAEHVARRCLGNNLVARAVEH